jgi:hypothetical protein
LFTPDTARQKCCSCRRCKKPASRDDFTQTNATYDVVFDAVGELTPEQRKKVLKPGGVYLNVHADSEGGDRLESTAWDRAAVVISTSPYLIPDQSRKITHRNPTRLFQRIYPIDNFNAARADRTVNRCEC